MNKSLAIACLATLLSACGGGGGGGVTEAPRPPPAADTTPPSVVAFVPSASDDVPRNTEISATLSEALLASTVSDSNVRITRSGAAVQGSLKYDATNRKISFVPPQALDVLARYTVTAGTGLKDLAGNSLAGEKSWSFRTADGRWDAPRRLDAETATSLDSGVAQDGQGNMVVVWSSQGAGGFYEIRMAVQGAGAEWGGASTLSTPGSYNALSPRIRFDNRGNGLAIWTQSDREDAEVWSSRFVKGTGWQTPTRVDSGLTHGYHDTSLAFDADGNAVGVWAKRVSEGQYSAHDIWAARFTSTGGWQASTRLGSSANIGTYDQAEHPQVALDAAGNAYVLWVQRNSDAPVWIARYQGGSGWQAAVSLGAARLGDPYAPRLAVSNSGQVMALWNTFVYAGGPYRFDLWWSVLATPGGNWTSPAPLENDDAGHAFNQALVADSAGNFHAVWQQHASDYRSDLVHRQYIPGSGWNAVTTVSTTNGTDYNNRAPSLVADRNGNLMALWGVYQSGQGGAQEGTFARRYAAGEGWRTTLRVGTVVGAPAFATSLDVQADGAIAATWIEPATYSNAGAVSAARFK